MACIVGKMRPMSLFDAKEAAGMEHGWSATHKERIRREGDRLVRKSDNEILAEQIATEKKHILPSDSAPLFICGSGLTQGDEVCVCGYFADLLCDYPIGRGKTCDLPLCSSCAHDVAEVAHELTLEAIPADGVTAPDLAREFGIEPTAMNNRLARLERLGLIKREPIDGRKTRWRRV